jgi:hypothetical protein
MRPKLQVGIAGVALAVTLVALLSGTAAAYFSTTGAGSASAGVSKLSAPSFTTAAQTAVGAVALTWSAVTAPGPGAVSYELSRDGGDPAGTCPTPPSAVLTCLDSGLALGTHSYTVVARWRSWSASATSTVNVTPGTATHFDLEAASVTPTAGATNSLTITALDANDNTVTTYTGSHSLVFSGASAGPGGTNPTVSHSGGTAIAFGSATAISFSSGKAVVSGTKNGVMRLYRSGPAEISVSEGSLTSSPNLAVTVAPAATSKISLSVPTTTPVAGASNDLTITVSDAYGNPIPSYDGSRNLTFSGPSASPGGYASTVSNSAGIDVALGSVTAVDFSAGVANVSDTSNGVMKLYKSGSTNLKVSNGSLTSANVAVTVAAAAASVFTLTAASATPTAGAADNLTTTAFDPYGNTATSYTGLHNLFFSGASASPGGNLPTVSNSTGTATAFGSATAINFSAGKAGVSSTSNGVMRLSLAGPASITVSEGAISNATPLAVTVGAAAASKLAYANVAISAGSLGSPCLFTCAVTGLGNNGTVKANILVTDAYGNTANAIGSGHSVKVTSSGGTVSGGTLTIAAGGPALSTAQFTYTGKSSGAFNDTITAATSAGTTYTPATLTANK